MCDDGEQRTVDGGFVLEGSHGSGPSSYFAKSSFDSVCGAYFAALILRLSERLSQPGLASRRSSSASRLPRASAPLARVRTSPIAPKAPIVSAGVSVKRRIVSYTWACRRNPCVTSLHFLGARKSVLGPTLPRRTGKRHTAKGSDLQRDRRFRHVRDAKRGRDVKKSERNLKVSSA